MSGLRLRVYIRWHTSAAAVGCITLCSPLASEAVGDGRKLLSDLIKVAPGCWFFWLLVPEGSDSWVLYVIGSLCLAVRVWQSLTRQQEQRTSTWLTAIVAVTALPDQQAAMAVALAEQVAALAEDLTAAPTTYRMSGQLL